jgi:hypothetical protein
VTRSGDNHRARVGIMTAAATVSWQIQLVLKLCFDLMEKTI